MLTGGILWSQGQLGNESCSVEGAVVTTVFGKEVEFTQPFFRIDVM